MDPHELAKAALNEVANSKSSGHRRDTTLQETGVTAASSRSSPNATGVDIMDNEIDDIAAGVQEQSHLLQRADRMSSNVEDSQGFQSSAMQGLHSISSDNSQLTGDGNDISTPPTSASDGFSSQSTNAEGQLSQLSQLSQLAAAQQPMTETFGAGPNSTVATTAGQKRTADGQVKPTLFKSTASPRGSSVRGHARNTSAVSVSSISSSSRIGELSSELRTRLSYAMVKVNNGWQSNSIDEVESLASQAGSPTSSTSTLHGRRNLITSPRTVIADIQAQTSSLSANPGTQAPTQDFDLYSRTDQPSRTYESFWRDHSTFNAFPTHRSSHVASPKKLTLAPSADIRPTSSYRRSHTPKFSKPPTMPSQGSNSSLHTPTPRTPNRIDYMESKSLQTPTQKTIQEQDAIETLLFMSSPGNSGNMGHAFPPGTRNQGSPQQSPLRAEFNVQGNRGAQGRRVGFEKVVAGGSSGSSEGDGYPGGRNMEGRGKAVGSRRSDAIDRLLDEMGDSSSDEEELVLNYSSPRRVAAGRV